jgi:murein DD-endopeptidase MepM/ murein hydrolase activator NlpD
MRRMRSNNKIFSALALVGVVAVCAAPALAAETVTAGNPLQLRLAVPKIADWAQRTVNEERRRQRARERAEGPFVPIVGKVDYGSAENGFGAARSGHTHAGQDMFAKAGTPLVAATDAVAIDAGTDGGQGNYVHLYDTERKLTYVYMHMIEPAAVREGERVRAGEQVGGVGCTGSCWGDHLHFEVRDGRGWQGEPRNPMPVLEDWRPLDEPR